MRRFRNPFRFLLLFSRLVALGGLRSRAPIKDWGTKVIKASTWEKSELLNGLSLDTLGAGLKNEGVVATAMSAETKSPDLEPNIKSVSLGQVLWLNIEKPTSRETEYLGQHYPFHAYDLEDCLSRIERSKLDRYEDYLFLMLHFPVFHHESRVSSASQVAIFVGQDFLITLHAGDLKPLTSLFQECQTSERAREESLGHSSGYLLYRILDRLVDYLFPILNRVMVNVEQVEEGIFGQEPQETVRDLAVLRRDIISLRRIVRPQITVIDSLERMELLFFPKGEELAVYFGDIGDHMRKIWDSLEDYYQVVEVLADTSNSLTSFRTNQVMRVLTVIATIMMPLTLVASVYGMNFDWLPFAGSAWGFWLMMGLMGIIAAGMLYFFRRQRWL